MNISHLPIATNLAKPSPALTQLHVSKGTTAVPTEPSQETTYEATLISSDKAYTKESAILKQWNHAGSFNLYDVLNGKVSAIKLQSPNPSKEELAAFEKALQENGISKEIDWGDFEFDLRGMNFRSENTGYSLNPDIFNRKTDYLASRYAAMQDKILRNTSGEETEKQMKKLDLLYSEALEIFARDYSEAVGGFLNENGFSEEKEKIYQSVLSGTDKKAEAYAKYLSENPDFTNLKGTADEWLLEDDEYIASLLREHPNIPPSSQTAVDGSPKTEAASYTMDELDILGRYTAELSNFDNPSAVYQMDEERIGLDFAMLAMKTDTLSANGKLSRKMEDTLKKLLDGFMNGFLDRMDRQMDKKRAEAHAVSDEKGSQR